MKHRSKKAVLDPETDHKGDRQKTANRRSAAIQKSDKSTAKIKIHCAYDKMIPIEKVIGNPKNPNQHPEKQIRMLADFIRARGWRAPITVSKRSGFVVRGHCRLLAAYLLGCREVPVDYQNYKTEAEEWADLVADNKVAELAEMDKELERKMIRELKKMDFDLLSAGYDEKELEKLFKAEGKSEDEAGEVEFTEELLEEHNYIVLYFDNSVDWLQALSLFDLKRVKSLDSRKGFKKEGVGRVLYGPKALNQIMGKSK